MGKHHRKDLESKLKQLLLPSGLDMSGGRDDFDVDSDVSDLRRSGAADP